MISLSDRAIRVRNERRRRDKVITAADRARLPRGQMMADRSVAQIRIATPEDAHGLGVMHVASWRETYTGLLPDKMLSSLSVEARASPS